MAKLLGRTRDEIEEILKNNDVIELRLSERKPRHKKKEEELRICE